MQHHAHPAAGTGSEGHGVARLRVEHRVATAPAAICRALADPAWLGSLVEPPDGRAAGHRVQCDLEFDLWSNGRRLAFHRAALVDLEVVPGASRCEASIAWRAASFAPLFPVFAGRLVVEADRLRLDGYYTPPGDGLGLLIDRVLLRHVARRTGAWFLTRIADQVTRELTPGAAGGSPVAPGPPPDG